MHSSISVGNRESTDSNLCMGGLQMGIGCIHNENH